jgi:hypothetical protein
LTGHQFRVEVRARDNVSNYSPVYSTFTFYYDIYVSTTPGPERPDSLANSMGSYTNSANISGTANDWIGANLDSGQITFVEYAIKEIASNKWYAGVSFSTTTQTWMSGVTLGSPSPTTGELTWSKNNAFAGATTGNTYHLLSRARDNAYTSSGTISPNIEVVYTTVTFIWDLILPTSTITGAQTAAGNISMDSSMPPAPTSNISSDATFFGV